MKIVYCDACGILLANPALEKEIVRVGNDSTNDACRGCASRLRAIFRAAGWTMPSRGLVADTCTRSERHEGPCNGMPRKDCAPRRGNFDTYTGTGCDECGNTHGDAHSPVKDRGIVLNFCPFCGSELNRKYRPSLQVSSADANKSEGGLVSEDCVEITDESLLPDSLCTVTVTMRADVWRTAEFDKVSGRYALMWPKDAPVTASTRVPSLSLIVEALGKPCLLCCGAKTITRPAELRGDETVNCPECGGSGRASVPGARLKP